MRTRFPPWAWLPVGVAVGLAAARLVLAPRILERRPAAGASAPSTTEIRITFDRPMDEGSVLERLRIDAVRPAGVRWQESTLIYQPPQAWPSGAAVEVRLEAGAKSARGAGTLTATSWTFTVAPPRLVYLWPAEGTAQVHAWMQGGAEAVSLTAAPAGVTDFSVGARGTRLAYVAAAGEGPAEIRELDLATGRDRRWLACPEGERCSSPELSPDGSRLAYVRASPPSAASGQRAGRVWLLEAEGQGAVPVSAQGDIASAPFWSPQGWLAFVDSTRGAILVVDPARGEPFAPLAVLPCSLGERGAWSPRGDVLIYPDLILPSEATAHTEGEEASLVTETHLFRWEVLTGELLDLTAAGGRPADDASPAFTPDGEWLFFSRRSLAAGEWTLGRQLWRMRADGSEAEQLTQDAAINHGAPAAGPRLLSYLRFDMQAQDDPAEIWWLDVDAHTSGLVAVGGYLPVWIP